MEIGKYYVIIKINGKAALTIVVSYLTESTTARDSKSNIGLQFFQCAIGSIGSQYVKLPIATGTKFAVSGENNVDNCDVKRIMYLRVDRDRVDGLLHYHRC